MSLVSNYKLLYGPLEAQDLSKVPDEYQANAIEKFRNTRMNQLLGMARDNVILQEDKDRLKDFLAATCNSDAIGKYLFDANFALKKIEEKRSRSDNILNEFQKLTARYGYFEAQNALHSEVYKRCYDICEHTAKFIEHNDQADEVASRAFKMMALFSPDPLPENVANAALVTCQNIDNFLTKHQSNVHDTLMHDLPEYHPSTPEFNLPKWKSQLLDLRLDLGMDLVRNFSDVPKIEGIIKSDVDLAALHTNYPEGLPRNKKSLDYLLSKAKYDRYEENPEFGKIFKSYNTPEEMFNRALDLMKSKELKTDESGKNLLPKDQDSIPDVALKVPGSDNLYLVKLPAHNPRALILGQITHCCQSVSQNSEKCVIDGVNLSNNGFYVFVKGEKGFDPEKIDWENLERKAKIVGQSYVWLGKDGALTLDSLEVLGSFRDKINVKDTMEALGKELSQKHQEIPRITLGMGGGTDKVLRAGINEAHEWQKVPYPESMKEGDMYGDAENQYEVYVSDKLRALRSNFSKIVKSYDERMITSQAQSDFLIAFSQKYPDMNLNDIPSSLLKDHFLRKEGYDIEKLQQIYSDILSIPSEKRDICAKGFAEGWWKINDIKDLTSEQFERVTSSDAIKGYKAGLWDKEYIAGLTSEQFNHITSQSIMEAYNKGWWVAEDIKSLSADQFMHITSWGAIEGYKAGLWDKDYIAALPKEVFDKVTFDGAIQGYKVGLWDKEYIIDLPKEVFDKVTNYLVIEGYKAGVWDKEYIIDLPKEVFDKVTFWGAIQGYKAGLWDKEYIIDLPKEVFDKVVTNYTAIDGCIRGLWDKEYIAALPKEVFEKITLPAANLGCIQGWWNKDYIAALPKEVFDKVTHYALLDGYKKGYFKPDDIAKLTPEQFKQVISPATQERFKSGMRFQEYLREISPPAQSPRRFAEQVQNDRANGQLGRV